MAFVYINRFSTLSCATYCYSIPNLVNATKVAKDGSTLTPYRTNALYSSNVIDITKRYWLTLEFFLIIEHSGNYGSFYRFDANCTQSETGRIIAILLIRKIE